MKYTVLAAEATGTFGLMIAATGSIVYDAVNNYAYGLGFIVLMHMLGLWFLVFVFGRYSMAHFNPAVTLGFAVTGHIQWRAVPAYVGAQAAGAVSGSLFVLYALGNYANLGLNSPDPSYGMGYVVGIEAAATVLLMGGILCIIRTKVSAPVVGVVVGGIVALDVWFFGQVSGASMNPIRSFAPALVTGMMDDMWLYVVAPMAGALVPAAIYRTLREN